MNPIGDLVVRVTADTAAMTRQISQQVNAAGSSAGKGFGKAFGAASAAALGAAAAGGAGLIAAATAGVKLAAANEQAAVSFKVLLGSGEKAAAFMKDLGEFAAKTPFDLPSLRDAASRLLATGANAESVIPIMGALGDATAAMGTGADGINRSVAALQKMSITGKVTMESINMLSEAGIPVLDALAAQLGQTPAQVAESISQGAIKVEDVFTAIESRAGEGFQRVTGLMDQQSATLAGQFSTLKDTVEQSLAQAAEPLAKSLQGALPGITAALDGLVQGLGPAFAQVGDLFASLTPILEPLGATLGEIGAQFVGVLAAAFTALQPIIPPLTDVLAQFVSALGDGLLQIIQAIGPILPTLAGAFVTIAQALIPLIPIAADLLVSMTPLIEIFAMGAAGIAEFIAMIAESDTGRILIGVIIGITAAVWALNAAMAANPIGLIILAIVGLVGLIMYAWNNFDWFRNAVIAVWEGIQAAVAVVVDWWQSYVGPAISAVIDFLIGYYTTLWGIVKFVWDAIYAAIETVVSWFQTYVAPVIGAVIGAIIAYYSFLWNAVQFVWNAIRTAAEAVIRWFQAYVAPVISAVVNAVVAYFRFLWAIVQFVWAAIQAAAQAVIEWFQENVAPRIQAVIAIVTAAFQGLRAGISAVWNGITGFISSAISRIQGILQGIGRVVAPVIGFFQRILSGVTEKISGLISLVTGIPGRILSALGNLGSLLYNAGRTVIEGFLNGLKSMFDQVTGFFTDLTDRIPTVKGPPPRDAVLLRENGRLIMDGLIAGFQDREGAVRGNLQAFTNDLARTRVPAYAGSSSAWQAPRGSSLRGAEVTYITNITNPKPEKASESLPAALRRASFTAGWGAA